LNLYMNALPIHPARSARIVDTQRLGDRAAQADYAVF